MQAILSSMVISIYNFLYRPDGIVDIFTEFNDYVWNLYSEGWFGMVFAVLKVIGIGLLMVSCLMSLADKVTEGDFTIHVLFRHLLKYVILYMVLWNSIRIFRILSMITTLIFNDINTIYVNDMTASINPGFLENGIGKMNALSKIGMFMMVLVPYIISLLYYIILYFFATSRLIESVLRIAMAPLVVGMSYFGKGDNSDIVRYTKRTMGVFFQIVVILVISIGLTYTHNVFFEGTVTETAFIKNPADKLQIDNSHEEIKTENTWNKIPETDEETNGFYTADSISDFVDDMVNIKYFAISTGLMLSALLLIFKSREISTRMF